MKDTTTAAPYTIINEVRDFTYDCETEQEATSCARLLFALTSNRITVWDNLAQEKIKTFTL
ncbi:hypothetical protein LCGC14_1042290 [marine sediment metagenome]|uniref:Uncharacterized protein n=1 Tax=marine sediment metagenome TaxID=412755 RepID=A0A0F9QXL8_9ZZZZ